MKFLGQKEMIEAGVADIARCIDVMEEAFTLLGRGDYVMGGSTRNSHGQRVWFPREPKFEGMPRGGPDQRFMGLQGYLGGRFKVCGNKWYGSNIFNPRDHGLPRSILLMTINDAETARPLAVMEGNILSGMRTGAVVGLSARYLAPENSETLGVIAAGPIARYSAVAILTAVPGIRHVRVFDINTAASERLAGEITEKFGAEVVICDNHEDAYRGMDVVTSAISGDHSPLLEDRCLKQGSLLTLPGRVNVEESYLLSAYIVPDNWEMQKTYKIEGRMLPEDEQTYPHPQLHGLVDQGKIKDRDIHDLGQVVAGNVNVDKNSAKRKYFISNGMILQDIAWAMTLYETAVEKGIGQELTLWDAPYTV